MERPEVITPDDVVRAGACREGVYKWINSHGLLVTTIQVGSALALCSDDEERAYIERAAGLNGDGYGDCYGDGYGDGYG